MSDNVIRIDVPIDLLKDHDMNPNEMSGREFDLLVDNMQQAVTDPILVWPKGAIVEFMEVFSKWRGELRVHGTPQEVWDEFFQGLKEKELMFQIIGGHHRVRAAQFLSLDQIPATVIVDEGFTEEMADTQLLRHNVIKGQINPQKFTKIYEKYKSELPDDVIQEMFGFADSEQFKVLIKDTEKSLPPEMKQKFKEATEEIKTIDDLSRVLSRLITTYGDTLKTGYMVIDEGGKRSIWLRMSKKTYEATLMLGNICVDNNVTMDKYLGSVVQLLAEGQAPELTSKILKRTPVHPTDIPENIDSLPTEDNLDTISKLHTPPIQAAYKVEEAKIELG